MNELPRGLDLSLTATSYYFLNRKLSFTVCIVKQLITGSVLCRLSEVLKDCLHSSTMSFKIKYLLIIIPGRFPCMWPINYARCLLLYHYLHDSFILSKYLNFLLNFKLGISILFTEWSVFVFWRSSKIPLTLPCPRNCVNIYKNLKSHKNSVIVLNVYH